MFEPENDIERALIDSVQQPTRRSDFLHQLLDAEVFVAMSCDQPLKADANGATTIPAGALLSERIVTDANGGTLFPFFTSPARARAMFKDDHVIAPDTPRKLFERHPGARFVLNPGSEHFQELSAAEVAKLLAGDFSPTVNTVTIERETKVLVSQPARYPTEMVEGLKRVFADHAVIERAWLAQVDFADGNGPHPMIGIEADGEWRDMMDGLRTDLPRAIPHGQQVDFMPYPQGSMSDYFDKIEPFYRRAKSVSGWRRWFGGRSD